MKRVVFLPDQPVDRPGDLFYELVAELGIRDYEIEGDAGAAEVVAFVGRERASRILGRGVKTGRQAGRLGDAEVYVLPATAPELRGRFYAGVWHSFAAYVLGRDLAVRDRFKGMAPEDIKADLDARRHPFGVCVANLVYDFNLGSIIRSANAFLAAEIWIYGRRRTDLRGAMGAHVYENVVHVRDMESFERMVEEHGYRVVCFEETPDAVPLAGLRWPERPLLVFGQEGPGVPTELLARADLTVVIPQFGSIRSLNAGVAAGIAMYDWHAKHGQRTEG